ncbi:uncharacterized protein N7459_000889 [Penicillium hispanicum]|uniref:uncharacterized protein n=1 Tax=Penicillium hispanicum TaxID=1080232 RepID=UPI00253FB500|nr:uncharacterized protein N7459_000889 [Penicillium hispanicum]KAJ5594681.1 hypothetical protein N7459_000889 [Penicillium hispanicum]
MMGSRTGESPMDFEWQTRGGPGDVTSPFYQLGVQHENKKRTHSAFDSPEKKQFPSLRAPNSQPFLFSQPQQPPPPPSPKAVFGQSAFMTPRKFDVDFSSGAENMSSPDNADNEDTPEQPARTERRNSLFNLYGRFPASPGRGEIPRMNHYSNAAVRKIQKNRRRNKELNRRLRTDSDDESDRPSSSEGRVSKSVKHGKEPGSEAGPSRMSSLSEFLAMLEAHPNIPSILSWWAQLMVNLSLFSLAVYIVFTFVSAIRAEFDQAAEEVSDTIMAEMANCAKSYVDNKCSGDQRLPALETVCENWERCMNRDPAKVGRAKVSAHTMAIIINSFIDPISWKAVLIFLFTISTVTVVSNWSFRSFRSRHGQPDYSQHHNYNQQQSHNQPMHAPPLHLQQHPSMAYYGQDPRQNGMGYSEKQDAPLMLENTRSMDFVTERSREREEHLRTPSPSKRDRRFA